MLAQIMNSRGLILDLIIALSLLANIIFSFISERYLKNQLSQERLCILIKSKKISHLEDLCRKNNIEVNYDSEIYTIHQNDRN